MADINFSQLQTWLERRFDTIDRNFGEVRHRLLMLESAVNDFARLQPTAGEMEAVHARLSALERRVDEIERR